MGEFLNCSITPIHLSSRCSPLLKFTFSAMFGSHKVARKEKKNAKENDFLIFDFTIKNSKKKKLNIIKIIKKFVYFKIIYSIYRRVKSVKFF